MAGADLGFSAIYSELLANLESTNYGSTGNDVVKRPFNYFRVLRMLRDHPDVTQRVIAQQLGVSSSGLKYCLNTLIDKVWVKVHNFRRSENKFDYIYVVTLHESHHRLFN